MRQLQFIPYFDGKPAKRMVFTAYFLTDEELFTMATDVLKTGNFTEKKGAYELKITQQDGVQRSYYTNSFPREALTIFADYSRRKKTAQADCEKRWPEFWKIAGETWKVTVVLFEMERQKALKNETSAPH